MPVPKPSKLAIVFAAMAATFAISSGDATAQRKITATFVAPNLSQTIPWIAKEAGIFAKSGIDADVILLTGSPRAVQTLLAGDIEYTIAGGQSAIRARMYGADPVMLATSANFSSQRVLLRPEIHLAAAARFERQNRRRYPIWFGRRYFFASRAAQYRPAARR